MPPHRPLVGIALSFCTGIVLADSFPFSFRVLCLVTIVLLFSTFIFWGRGQLSTILLFVFFILLGALLFQSYQYAPRDHIDNAARYCRGKIILLEGVITSDVEKRRFGKGRKTTFTLRVTRLQRSWGWQEKIGKIRVQIFREADLSYGDRVLLEGKLHPPFDSDDGNLSYKEYLKQNGIQHLLSVKKNGRVEVREPRQGHFLIALALRLKHRLKKIFATHLTPPEAALAQAMILGDRYDIPQHLRELFVKTGTAHILAISGQNVGIVAFLIFLLLRMIGLKRKIVYLLTIVFLIFYALMTGAQPSIVRATVMAVVFFISFTVERETDILNSLALAGLVILMVNPFSLFDVGFQLSFVSVLTIILWVPPLLRFLARGYSSTQHFLQPDNPLVVDHSSSKGLARLMWFFLQSFAVSLAVWVGVAGLIVYYFQIVTPVTILANLVVVPLMTLVMALGFGVLLAGAFLPGCAFMFAACLKAVLNGMVASTFLLSLLPGAYFYLRTVPWRVVLLYYLIIVTLFYGIKGSIIRRMYKRIFGEWAGP
jgi:competence protein ComEC